MTRACPILRIERAPGDRPDGVEQLNGDLLLPAAARPLIEKALLLAQDSLGPAFALERAALLDACRILNIERLDRKDPVADNLLKVSPI